MPNTRQHAGVWSMQGGTQFYRHVLKWHLSTNLHPETVHSIGLEEVERIEKEMGGVSEILSFCCNMDLQARSQRGGVPGARTPLLQNLNKCTYIYLSIYTTQQDRFVHPPHIILATHFSMIFNAVV